jgi:hypothetical protein
MALTNERDNMTKQEVWAVFRQVSDMREELFPGDVSLLDPDAQKINRAFMKFQDSLFTSACNKIGN